MYCFARTTEDPKFKWAKQHLHTEDGVLGVGNLLAFCPSFQRKIDQTIKDEKLEEFKFEWPAALEGLTSLIKLCKPLDKAYKPVDDQAVEPMLGPGYEDFKKARKGIADAEAAKRFKKIPKRIQLMWSEISRRKIDEISSFDDEARRQLTELLVRFYEWEKCVDAAQETVEAARHKAKRDEESAKVEETAKRARIRADALMFKNDNKAGWAIIQEARPSKRRAKIPTQSKPKPKAQPQKQANELINQLIGSS